MAGEVFREVSLFWSCCHWKFMFRLASRDSCIVHPCHCVLHLAVSLPWKLPPWNLKEVSRKMLAWI